ncbi:hypothetical protein [Haloimpatiens massiliensis]|uniref:hypothetical protein n=1 Tax=Haloimpatiens massiliensis TaxID=1658110 RepID=UPI000C835467|nr:hypothetical protein [Haloimpatiens massiliensis]
MEYTVLLAFIIISGLFTWNSIGDLNNKNQKLITRLDNLADKTGNPELSSKYVSVSLKDELISLKNEGKMVKAVKLLRDNTSFNLVQAKEYVDNLEFQKQED